MRDQYFKHPLLYDYILAFMICCILFYMYQRHYIDLPKAENSISTTTDLATIA